MGEAASLGALVGCWAVRAFATLKNMCTRSDAVVISITVGRTTAGTVQKI